MPATFNGIGSMYYGCKNPASRAGDCPHCGRRVVLSSYDTRLWLVFLHIPVVPLSRMRVVDFCPACTKHLAVDLAEWEKTRTAEVTKAFERFHAHPTPETAVGLHQCLLGFQQTEKADQFAVVMGSRFPDDAEMQAYVGTALQTGSQWARAEPYFERAHRLRPDLPGARIGLARARLRAERLDEARELLDFVERPGREAPPALGALEELAYGFQEHDRHAEALTLFARLLEARPVLAQDAGFRAAVKRSERVQGLGSSLLPAGRAGARRSVRAPAAWPVSVRRVGPWAASAAVLIALGFLVANEYIRRHRTLHVLNSFEVPLRIEIAGRETINARPGRTEVSLPEGTYRAAITGPIREELEFGIRASYFSRWYSEPVWVLAPGGDVLLALEDAVYAAVPPPPDVSVHFGRAFYGFPHVTHPFEDLPESLRLHAGEQRRLTRLEWFRLPPVRLFADLIYRRQTTQAVALAEWRLARHPTDTAMLSAYVGWAEQESRLDRLEPLLAAGLSHRPVVVEWHRAYQDLGQRATREAALRQMYDRFVAAEPTNAALLYLRGRLSPSPSEGRQWFARALEQDPSHPFALSALAFDHCTRGEWIPARDLLIQALGRGPDQPDFAALLVQARVALGEHALAVQELQAVIERGRQSGLGSPPTVWAALCALLAALGRTAEIWTTVEEYEQLAAGAPDAEQLGFHRFLRAQALYTLGQFNELARFASAGRTPTDTNAHFWALVELDRLAEATRLHPLDEPGADDPFHFLAVSVAWRRANAPEADRWLAKALELLAGGDDDGVRAGRLLASRAAPSPVDLDELSLPPAQKSLLLAALAQLHPDARSWMAAQADLLNVGPFYPCHLIRRVVAAQR